MSAEGDGPPGVIALKGVLGEEGRVVEVDVVRQTDGGGRFRLCVLKAVGGWRSPIGRIGAKFALTVPLRPSATAG